MHALMASCIQMHQMSGGTLTLTEPLLSWYVAVTITVPFVTNVITPASDTVATLGSELRLRPRHLSASDEWHRCRCRLPRAAHAGGLCKPMRSELESRPDVGFSAPLVLGSESVPSTRRPPAPQGSTRHGARKWHGHVPPEPDYGMSDRPMRTLNRAGLTPRERAVVEAYSRAKCASWISGWELLYTHPLSLNDYLEDRRHFRQVEPPAR